jgi:UDP-glucuronate decarboxylase
VTDLLSLLEENADLVKADLSPLTGKEVLVIGATGLIGINLIASIMRGKPKTVLAFGSKPPVRVKGPAWLGSWDDDEDTTSILGLEAFDYIVHAGGYAQPARFLADPWRTLDAGPNALRALLPSLKADGRLMFLSSAEVYSGSPNLPHTEEDIGTTRPDHARSCYIEGKRCGEAIVHAARRQGTNAVIARPCLAYGPGVRKGDRRLTSELIEQGLKGRIELKDAGLAQRCYGYISDQVEMLLTILLHGKQAVYNVGGRSKVTVNDLAAIIGLELEADLVIPLQADGSGAPAAVELDLSRYEQEFGPKSFVLLEEGLARTIAWHRALEAEA